MKTLKPKPVDEDFQELVLDEERTLITRPDVPDEVKTEILERIEISEETEPE